MAQADASSSGAQQGSGTTEDVDWSSVEQVANLVSKSTLAGLKQLWQQHAAAMDQQGRSFAEDMFARHSQAVKDIASVKAFDLKAVLELMNGFTGATREAVLALLQEMRRQDDDFTSQLYQTSRSAFSRNLRAALEARDAWYREKLRGMRQRHEAQLAAVRHAAQVELQQRQMQLKVALARTLARNARMGFDPTAFNAAAADASALPGAEAGAGGALLPSLDPTAASAAGGGGTAATRPAATTVSSALAAVAAAAASMGPPSGSNLLALQPDAQLAPEAAMLEELFEDANAADALARELEAGLAKANTEILDLKSKLDGTQQALQEAQADAGQWRSKWAIESSKTDTIKREAMAIISKCEEHVSQLQQQHIAELSQRDYLLQRCRDTITALEAKLEPRSSGGGAV